MKLPTQKGDNSCKCTELSIKRRGHYSPVQVCCVFTGNLPHQCTQCNKKFLNKYSLVFHMEAHSSKRFECRKCGTKFVHQKSYDQHQRAMCLGHRKRIAARKLQIAIPDTSDNEIPQKLFLCKYCPQEYNFQRTMEIHIQQKHPTHTGDITTAYTFSQKDGKGSEDNVNDTAINTTLDSLNDMEEIEDTVATLNNEIQATVPMASSAVVS